MSRRRRILLWGGGALVALIVLAVLLLPVLVDVNRYRDLIESRAEAALGREVGLGEMKLSVFPRLAVRVDDLRLGALPGEGDGDLLTARRLELGARLLPLLGKRLEVTSLVIQEPSLSLERVAGGGWNVQRLVAGDAAGGEVPAAAGGAAPAFSVGTLRITGGRVVVRDGVSLPGRPLEATLSGLDVRLRDVALDRPIEVDLAAALSLGEGCRIRLAGKAGPLTRPPGEPLRLGGTLGIERLDAGAIAGWVEALAGKALPPDLLGERPFSASLDFQAALSQGEAGTSVESAAVQRLALSGADLTLRRDAEGTWNVAALLGGGSTEGAAAAQEAGPQVSLADLSITGSRLRFVDASGSPPLDVTLDPVDLSLDRLPTEAAARVRLVTSLKVSGAGGTVSVEGSLGPLAGPGLPLDASFRLDGIPMALAAPYLEGYVDAGGGAGSVGLDLTLSGDLSAAFEARGSGRVVGARVQVAGLEGGQRTVPIDAALAFDASARGGGDLLELRRFDLSAGGNELRLRGTLDRSEAVTRVDVALLPARIPAADLAGLLALAEIPLPVSMTSDQPMEIEARARGPVGGGAVPQLEGRVVVRGFMLRHPSMTAPLEEVSAAVTLRGETVSVTGFSGRIGGSDIAGDLTLEGFDAPRLQFDLRSNRADFWELLSFVSSSEESADAAGRGAAAGGLPGGATARGTLRIESGSFRTLRFTGLEAGLALQGSRVDLDPFRMDLYGGRFQGTTVLELGAGTPSFRIHSEVDGLDLDPLLAENLDAGGQLSGRFSGVIDAQGAGTDYESVVRALSGSGKVELLDGRVGKLDVLGVLSRAAGVFGEDTLRTLSRKLQKEGTDFKSLTGSLRLGGGAMTSPDLLLVSEDLELQGTGRIDLLGALLKGDFQIVFSDALSRSMRDEGSRAAQVFWDPATDRVSLLVGLAGPFESPSPSIDWKTTAKRVATRKVEGEVRKQLGRLLGGEKKEGEKPAPAGEPVEPGGGAPSQALAGEGEAPPAAPSGAPPGEPGGSGAPAAEITRVRWGGSILVKDLKIEGVIRGAGIDHAVVVVADARGREVYRTDRLGEVASYLARPGVDPAAEATIEWDITVDGKDLLRASEPFTIRVEVVATDGARTAATRQATR